MHIIDFQNLVDSHVLECVAKHHPLYSDIASEIKMLTIKEKDQDNIHIQMDESLNVTLATHPIIQPSERDMYILYHEFGHIADRLNPDFHYDHHKRLQLTQAQEICFLQLWNVFIDARLHHHGLFRLPPAGRKVEITVDGITYSLPQNDISTYLLQASAHLMQRGVRKPGALVTGIWNNPQRFLSFDDLLDPVVS